MLEVANNLIDALEWNKEATYKQSKAAGK